MTMLFKHLTEEEEKPFREWARKNYKTFDPIDGIWHPVVQDECVKMNMETGASPDAFDPPGPVTCAEYWNEYSAKR